MATNDSGYKNPTDYAVVVGISKYPGLGPESPELDGPENDVNGIVEWLTSKTGGSVPPKNVMVIRSKDYPGTDKVMQAVDAMPNYFVIEREFRLLQSRAETNSQAGLGRKVGRRLYIYVSGHGYSPDENHGCLYSADATSRDAANVFVSGWMRWFRDGFHFDEYVLWMDCCMDRQFIVMPGRVPPPQAGSGAAGPAFIAFAAKRGQKAAECTIAADNNKVHGVFTWTLLEGLRGRAADPPNSKKVTAQALANYLRNVLKTHLPPALREVTNIALLPDIIKVDPELVFTEGGELRAASADTPVTLIIPPKAIGKPISIQPGPALPRTSTSERLNVELEPGVYVATLDGLAAGFAVGGQSEVVLDFQPAPPQGPPNAGQCTITIFVGTPGEQADPTAEIVLVDSKFRKVGSSFGFLFLNSPPGVYKVQVKAARSMTEQIVNVAGELNLNFAPPAAVTAAPLSDSSRTHEYHEEGMFALRQAAPISLGCGAELSVMARTWTKSGKSDGQKGWQALKILNSEREVLCDLSSEKAQHEDLDPFVTKRLDVPPGAYFIRQELADGTEWEHSVVACADWNSMFFLLHTSEGSAGPIQSRTSAPQTRSARASSSTQPSLTDFRRSLLMTRISETEALPFFPSSRMDSIVERARIALADDRRILNFELQEMLMHKFQNPIAGIIGALLMISEAERSGDPGNLGDLDIVVPNLRKLVGSSHPDVEAISLHCPNPSLWTTKSITAPPMFFRSWQVLIRASKEFPEIIPAKFWNRIFAGMNAGGFLLWPADQRSRKLQEKGWSDWVAKLSMEVTFPEERPQLSKLAANAPKRKIIKHFSEITM
jgi:uncharacterized caspase-like protein